MAGWYVKKFVANDNDNSGDSNGDGYSNDHSKNRVRRPELQRSNKQETEHPVTQRTVFARTRTISQSDLYRWLSFSFFFFFCVSILSIFLLLLHTVPETFRFHFHCRNHCTVCAYSCWCSRSSSCSHLLTDPWPHTEPGASSRLPSPEICNEIWNTFSYTLTSKEHR